MERTRAAATGALAKSPTGIAGLDEILRGGLPRGRPTLVCGGAGCGKTVLAMEFLVRGVREQGEPGLFVSFEEGVEDLRHNFASLGFDLPGLMERKQLHLMQVQLSREEIQETGRFSLDGLLIRLEQGLAQVGARRVVLDTLETLFSHLSDSPFLRSEIARLFRWLKDKGVTSIVTGERGASELTQHGLQEYISDCVLLLDHRVQAHVSKRRLRVVKYRGSRHGADEYPFIIGETGVSVTPITSVTLEATAGTDVVSSGVDDLDAMLGRQGYYRGSSVLVSGTAGTGKSTLCAAFAAATCRRSERCLYFAFEESESQILRNMRSVGIDLAPWIADGWLQIEAARPTFFGLEEHLVSMLRAVDDFEPHAVVLDPITNFLSIGATDEVKSMLVRVFDRCKSRGITALVTSLTSGSAAEEGTDTGVSSLMDAWLVLRHRLDGARRGRWLYVVKTRGMANEPDTHELIMSPQGLALRRDPPVAGSASSQQPPRGGPP